ncbi:MAG: hypothetical protein WC606_05290 [Candidatus Absconditabacterales bacterium]
MQLKIKIISIYENIFEKFCKGIVKFEIGIQKMERGIIMPNGEEYYENYFESTHTEIKEKLRRNGCIQDPLLMVTKVFTYKGQEIIFSTDTKNNLLNKNIIYLDDALATIPKTTRHLFYDKISELKSEEKIFWQRKNLEKIQILTQNEIVNRLIMN